jgi:hypothetical protein
MASFFLQTPKGQMVVPEGAMACLLVSSDAASNLQVRGWRWTASSNPTFCEL